MRFLNVVLISMISVVGAAVTTALSVAVGFTAAFRSLRSAIEFSIPFGEIVRQVLAAAAIGVVVYGTELLIESIVGLDYNFISSRACRRWCRRVLLDILRPLVDLPCDCLQKQSARVISA
jgi:O-antigen/teichoic acid export membrane protein